MQEVWKDIEDYKGLYQVSNLGRIRSLDRYVRNGTSNKNIKKGKILKPCTTKDGYLQLNLIKDKKKKVSTVHRLVAKAFIENSSNKPCVNHIDGDKQNNNVENLEWVTYSENTIHALKTGLVKKTKGKNHYKRAVNQYTTDGKFIRRWDSIKSIKDEWNLRHIKVSSCCRGKIKTSLGYVWKYAD